MSYHHAREHGERDAPDRGDRAHGRTGAGLVHSHLAPLLQPPFAPPPATATGRGVPRRPYHPTDPEYRRLYRGVLYFPGFVSPPRPDQRRDRLARTSTWTSSSSCTATTVRCRGYDEDDADDGDKTRSRRTRRVPRTRTHPPRTPYP